MFMTPAVAAASLGKGLTIHWTCLQPGERKMVEESHHVFIIVKIPHVVTPGLKDEKVSRKMFIKADIDILMNLQAVVCTLKGGTENDNTEYGSNDIHDTSHGLLPCQQAMTIFLPAGF